MIIFINKDTMHNGGKNHRSLNGWKLILLWMFQRTIPRTAVKK
jgi:hypothetical protein